jgi:Aromatic acid exporter family member 1
MDSSGAASAGLAGQLRRAMSSGAAAVRSALTKAGPERDTALLLLKASLATVLAWVFATRVLDSPTPFYAPMAALLVVDRTLVRSLWASVQRLVAVVVGMSAAWLVGSTLGVRWWSMLPVLLLALLVARWRQFGEHGIQVPTMVLLSLVTVGGTDEDFTYLTIVETLAGGVIGVVTNAVVLAPLHITEPRELVASITGRLRGLLVEIGEGLRAGWDADAARGWYQASNEIGDQAPAVFGAIATGRESTKLNPRELRPTQIDWTGYERTVEAVRRAQWHVSGIARTLVDAAAEDASQAEPSREFLERYAGALIMIGEALPHFGVAGSEESLSQKLGRATTELDALGEKVRTTPLDDPHAWPAYGALLLDAKRITHELAERRDEAVVPTDSGPLRLPVHHRWRRSAGPDRPR